MHTDFITLRDLQVQAVIHAVDPDARRRTRLDLEIDLHLDLEPAGRADDFAFTIDFFQVNEIVRALAEHGRWWMLESLALTLARTLLLPPAPGEARSGIDGITLRMSRPELMDGLAVPGIVIHRPQRWCTTERRVLGPGVAADVIAETRNTDLLRVRLTAGSSWRLPVDAFPVPLANVAIDDNIVSSESFPGALLVVLRK
jgi:7,8-dihydroneopterin aldolase/epimerase/oxygenase